MQISVMENCDYGYLIGMYLLYYFPSNQSLPVPLQRLFQSRAAYVNSTQAYWPVVDVLSDKLRSTKEE